LLTTRTSRSPALSAYTTLFRSENCRDPAAPGIRRHLGAQSSSGAGGADRMGTERKGLSVADGICADLTQASHQLQVFQRPESTRSEEHTSELQSRENLVCRLLL